MSEQEEDIFFDVDTSFREEEEVLAVGDGTDDEREPAQNLDPPDNNDADAPVDDEEDDNMAQAGNAVKPRIQVPMFDPKPRGLTQPPGFGVSSIVGKPLAKTRIMHLIGVRM